MRLFHSCDYRDGRIGECGLELIGFGHGCERGEQFVGVIHEPYGAFVLRRCSAVVGGPFAVRLACEPDGAATGFIETAGAAEQQIGFAASACANHGDVAVSYVKECGGDEYTVVAQSKRHMVPCLSLWRRQIVFACMWCERRGEQRGGIGGAAECRCGVDGMHQGINVMDRAAAERNSALTVMTVSGTGEGRWNQSCILGADQFIRLHLVGDA